MSACVWVGMRMPLYATAGCAVKCLVVRVHVTVRYRRLWSQVPGGYDIGRMQASGHSGRKQCICRVISAGECLAYC